VSSIFKYESKNFLNPSTYSNLIFLTIGHGDFLVHHAISLSLHITTLILVNAAFDANGSKVMLDKSDFGYSFPCNGSGDIYVWDAFYLALDVKYHWIGYFFYWCWKHTTIWLGNVSRFNESSTYFYFF
jgi:photosystem I P700 chlorophyll a apoprotein A2